MQKITNPVANQRPNGKLYLDTVQLNLVHGAETLVLLDTIPASFVDGIENTVTHRITPGVAGWYSIVGHISFSQPVANTCYVCTVKVSGVIVCISYIHAALAYDVSPNCVLPCHYLTNTDFVELYATSRSGGNTVDIFDLEPKTFLAVQRVR